MSMQFIPICPSPPRGRIRRGRPSFSLDRCCRRHRLLFSSEPLASDEDEPLRWERELPEGEGARGPRERERERGLSLLLLRLPPPRFSSLPLLPPLLRLPGGEPAQIRLSRGCARTRAPRWKLDHDKGAGVDDRREESGRGGASPGTRNGELMSASDATAAAASFSFSLSLFHVDVALFFPLSPSLSSRSQPTTRRRRSS